MKRMSLPCETVARYILPLFRSLVAKELIEEYNFTQTNVAEKLGTTQAAISQYIHSKRGSKGIEEFEDVLQVLQETARNTAKGIATEKMNTDEVMVKFCELCVSVRKEHALKVSN